MTPFRETFLPVRAFALALLFAAGAAQAGDTLLSLYRLALGADPDYQIARHAFEASEAQADQAFGALLPSVGIEASAFGAHAQLRGPSIVADRPEHIRFNSKRFELSATQPLFRRELMIAREQAGRRVQQSRAEWDAALEDLAIRVAERYFGVLRSRDEVAIAQGERDAFGRQLELARQRLEFGLVAITDVDEAQAGFDAARARVIESENAERSARDALQTITGHVPGALAPLREDSPVAAPEPANAEHWGAVALRQNVRILAAELAAGAARDDIRRARTGHEPTLDLVARQTKEHANGSAENTASEIWNTSLGLQVSIPLFRGGQILARTRESIAAHQQALQRLERERRNTTREARESFYGVQSGIARIEALQQAVRSAASAVENILFSYELGHRTSQEVLNAQRDLFRARRDLTGARYDYVLNMLRLKRAAGVLVEADVAVVNEWLEAAGASPASPAYASAERLVQRNVAPGAADRRGLRLETELRGAPSRR